MRRIPTYHLLIIVALLIASGACLGPAPTPPEDVPPVQQQVQASTTGEEAEVLPAYPLTVTDALGRKVTVSKPPQRIVSLAPANTEILFALGLDDRIMGVTDYCDYPETAKTKARVAGYTTTDLEELVSLQPDLIVAEDIHQKTVLPALDKLGLAVYVVEATSIKAILDNISTLGRITGKTTQASRLLDDMNSQINKISAKTQNLGAAQQLRVLYVNWHNPIWTVGSNSYINDVIIKAGGINVYAEDFEKARAVSLESVVTKNPQVIFVSGMGTSGDAVYNWVRGESRLSVVEAMLENRVYRMSNANLIERSGPRIVDGLIELARMIHPELFGEYK